MAQIILVMYMNIITMTEPLFGAYLAADIEEFEGIVGYMYVKGFNQIIVIREWVPIHR